MIQEILYYKYMHPGLYTCEINKFCSILNKTIYVFKLIKKHLAYALANIFSELYCRQAEARIHQGYVLEVTTPTSRSDSSFELLTKSLIYEIFLWPRSFFIAKFKIVRWTLFPLVFAWQLGLQYNEIDAGRGMESGK